MRTLPSSPAMSEPRAPMARTAASTTLSIPVLHFLIRHSSHSIHISIPPTFRALSHSSCILLSCHISSPAFRILRRRTLEFRFRGSADIARERTASAISARALVAFLDSNGTVDKVCESNESHRFTEAGLRDNCCSNDFSAS